MMNGADLHPKDHSIQIFTDALNEGWDSHSELVSIRVCGHTGKKVTPKYSQVEGGFSGPLKVQGPVSNQTVLVATDNSTVVTSDLNGYLDIRVPEL